MDKVPIAEQKTKHSVGKENTMNLSDHESRESDGDTDAMGGNEDKDEDIHHLYQLFHRCHRHDPINSQHLLPI
jgi:hypothetical protein